MYPYTKNNHFKFGYNRESYFVDRKNEKDQFFAEYGRCEHLVNNWREANELAAQNIYDAKQGDLWVLLSGGLDSEICLESFLSQKLTCKAVTLRYMDVNHQAELQFVEKLKGKYTFHHEYIDVNLQDLLKSDEFSQLLESIKCVSPIIGAHLWAANQLHGTPIIAQGEAHLKKKISADYTPGVSPYLPAEWVLVESERLCSIYMNFIKRKKPAVPGFFQYLPEQTNSFLTNNPILKNLVANKISGKLGTRTSKNLMSKQFYPELEAREKLHGWESIQQQHDELRKQLAIKFPHSDANFEIEMQELINTLRIR